VWWYRFARAPGCQRSLGVPDERDAQNRIEDYVDGYLPAGITRLLELTGCDEVSLLGYCFGGDLALLHAAHHPYSPLRSLTVMAAPVDLRHMGPLADVFGAGGLDVADVLNMDGNIPPQVVLQGFRMLKPTAQATRYVDLWERLWNDEYIAA
jgi:polyhydroxyalkanoate synthase subunit PhaC